MSDPVISPDGKWMWTGNEWIPAPPTSVPGAESIINLEDSMMSGNVNLEQNSSDASSVINLKDSAMSGDINIITQNNAEDIALAMIQALDRIDFIGQSSPKQISIEEEKELENILSMSDVLDSYDYKFEPNVEINLGDAARLSGNYKSAIQHYQKALDRCREENNSFLEAGALCSIGRVYQDLSNYPEAEKYYNRSLEIYIEHNNSPSQ